MMLCNFVMDVLYGRWLWNKSISEFHSLWNIGKLVCVFMPWFFESGTLYNRQSLMPVSFGIYIFMSVKTGLYMDIDKLVSPFCVLRLKHGISWIKWSFHLAVNQWFLRYRWVIWSESSLQVLERRRVRCCIAPVLSWFCCVFEHTCASCMANSYASLSVRVPVTKIKTR